MHLGIRLCLAPIRPEFPVQLLPQRTVGFRRRHIKEEREILAHFRPVPRHLALALLVDRIVNEELAVK